jgi:GMP synthase (glutamine-hydrolysing)
VARVLVVQNHPGGGPGRLGEWWARDGLELDVVPAYDGSPLPGRLGHDGIVVLGGAYLPDDDERAPWLPRTRELVRQALDGGTPVFGVCLGGQLLARVAGGAVRARHGRPEAGSTPLTLRPDAGADPLFHGLPRRVTAIEHHVDAITALPPGSVWLAESDGCPYQAFRTGDRAWGVQFHPEVTAERILRWDPSRLHGLDPAALHRAALADEPAAEGVWREVARRFAAVVRGEALKAEALRRTGEAPDR